MKLLISGIRGEIFPERAAKELYLCAANTIGELSEKIKTTSRSFGLFLAFNAETLKDDEILQSAGNLVEMGLAYLCAWGPDCERVHDLFDIAAGPKNDKLSGDDVIMTSWHARDTLVEALWFFVHAAFPTQCFEMSCTDWIIAPIGNPEWEKEIRDKIGEVAFEPPSE
jgi:hypothetical protein